MSKELVTKETATPQEVGQMKNLWDVPSISQRDVIIPAILLMQPMSPQVTDGKAAFGEWRETLNQEVLGKFEQGFEFVPFKLVKLFIEQKDLGDEKEFLRAVEITPQNENLPYEDSEMIEGKEVKIIRDRVMKFFVLLKTELDQGAAIPYTLSFKRTSYQAGQKLATQMFIKNLNSGKTPASMIMTVTAAKKTQENKTWAAANCVPMGPTPDKYISEAFRWLEIVNSGKAKEQPTEVVDTRTGEIKNEIAF